MQKLQWILTFALLLGGLMLLQGCVNREPSVRVGGGPGSSVYFCGSVHVLKTSSQSVA